jgi:hypothetical protein
METINILVNLLVIFLFVLGLALLSLVIVILTINCDDRGKEIYWQEKRKTARCNRIKKTPSGVTRDHTVDENPKSGINPLQGGCNALGGFKINNQ